MKLLKVAFIPETEMFYRIISKNEDKENEKDNTIFCIKEIIYLVIIIKILNDVISL